MTDRLDMDCAAVDELAPAYGLGAVDPREAAEVERHMATCPQPHAEARDLVFAAALVPAALAPVTPSSDLRRRIMATVAVTPQDHRRTAAAPAATAPLATAPTPAPREAPRKPWWSFAPMPATLAAVALTAAVGLGAWGVSVNAELAEREAALAAVAGADAVYAAEGPAGRGWVIESGDDAMFMAEGLAELESNELYEFWVIDAEGRAVAAGTLTDTDGVALVTLEENIDDATTFAVTVETERVEQSTNDPVMVADLGA